MFLDTMYLSIDAPTNPFLNISVSINNDLIPFFLTRMSKTFQRCYFGMSPNYNVQITLFIERSSEERLLTLHSSPRYNVIITYFLERVLALPYGTISERSRTLQVERLLNVLFSSNCPLGR